MLVVGTVRGTALCVDPTVTQAQPTLPHRGIRIHSALENDLFPGTVEEPQDDEEICVIGSDL
jgi:hypothetical protein